MSDTHLPLEDTPGDVLRKATLGTRVDVAQLADATGAGVSEIRAWLSDRALPDGANARAAALALGLDPEKFCEAAALGWYPPAIGSPHVRRHAQHPHPSNGYVFFFGDDRRAALIDPAGKPDVLLDTIERGSYRLEYVLVTHKHDDHCDAVADVVSAFPQARVVMHERDVHAIGSVGKSALLVRDGEDLPFGPFSIRMLHTPGHTDGSVCYLVGNSLFTGDTLFARSVGGAYGDESTYADILASIRSKLFVLPGETLVMPGHGPLTTLALEKEHNPFF